MGFPWKKVKSTSRISQMVKDQLHHRKNAASPLVVETGFPTSLVDLIVNHRDRFKKDQFHRRKKKKPPPSPPLGADDPPSPPSPLPPPAPSPTPLGPTSPPRSPIPAHEIDDGPTGGTVSEIDLSACVYSNKKFAAVLKMFLLLVLALGAKKFAVGITVSAFVLFFLDYLARNLFKCDHLLPCSKVQENLSLMLLEVRRFIISRIIILEEEIPQKDHEEIEEEIQIVQPIEKVAYRDETEVQSYCGKNIRPEGVKSMAELLEEDEEICELSISKNGKSRRAKIKSKVKKLFPKRIGNSRKTGKDLKHDINPTGEEGEFPIVEENEHTEYPERGLEPDVKDVELTKGVVETSEVSKSDFVQGETNSGYLVLVLVALVGLVMGGRVYALILTLIWCFLSKSGGAIMRSVKVS